MFNGSSVLKMFLIEKGLLVIKLDCRMKNLEISFLYYPSKQTSHFVKYLFKKFKL
ncbi:hypothetical protein SAMN05216357_102372 [Porphyromonadaceae bacterium KH3CP3RA]|nr:hypothetical protein SAMN05216357_102372 [Porphyromonadaceae bacterium KH3CP3RA]